MPEFLTLSGLGFALGCRHALDWDHFAAISDFVGVEEKSVHSLLLSIYYILGHGAVVLTLGLVALFFGQILPEWVDEIMERLVGATLIILGLWLSFTLIHNPGNHVAMSRGKLVATVIRKTWRLLRGTSSTNKGLENPAIGLRGACGVGVLHGIGGETATQVMLLAAAAGAGTVGLSLTVIASFMAGLLLAQVVVAGMVIMGFARVINNRKVYTVMLVGTSLYSVVIGVLFLVSKSGILPAFIGL